VKNSAFRRAGLAAVATSVALGTCLGAAGTASAANGFAFDRVAGDTRYDTSAATAAQFGNASTVIVASGEDGHFADALAASYLAGLHNAPVVLTAQDAVPTKVMDQITASGATRAFIVGGEQAVGNAVAQKLADAKLTVTRLSGADRYATAAKIIDEGDKAPTDTAILATGENFPDALGGGPLAYAEGMPLAITQPGEISDGVVASLKRAGISQVIVLGGTQAVSKAVVDKLATNGITVAKRYAGADRAETSALLAEQEVKPAKDGGYGFDDTAVNVASGGAAFDGVDALSAAPLSGKTGTPLLITLTDKLPGAAVLKFLNDHSATLTDGTIFGGTTAVTPAVETQMVEATGSGQATNTNTGKVFSSVQAALQDAATKAGDTIQVAGTVPGFTVTKSVKVVGQPGAKVLSAIQVVGVDGVEISNLEIHPSDVANQISGVYLDNAEGVTIAGNTFVGANQAGAGVINSASAEAEKATISGNTFRGLLQGIYTNPSATLEVKGNTFQDNVSAVANALSSSVHDNHFLNNEEGIGLSGEAGDTKSVLVLNNDFANSPQGHVVDYTTGKVYDLQGIVADNSFDEDVVVSADDTKIVDKS
jgi:putative cell wall-binding protein